MLSGYIFCQPFSRNTFLIGNLLVHTCFPYAHDGSGLLQPAGVEVAIISLLREAWPEASTHYSWARVRVSPNQHGWARASFKWCWNSGSWILLLSDVVWALPPLSCWLCWTFWQRFLWARSDNTVVYVHASVCIVSSFPRSSTLIFAGTHVNPLATV